MLYRLRVLSPIWNSPVNLAFCIFATTYLATLLYVRHVTYRDPGSWFFNKTLAYTRQYSETRRQQSDEYIKTASRSTFPKHLRDNSTTPDLCVGLAGLADDPARYLETSLGSLLEGLTGYERNRMYVLVYLVHHEEHHPDAIPNHLQPWMSNLIDEITFYKLSHIRGGPLKLNVARDERQAYYTDLLESCTTTGAPYTAIFEDETIALDGWFHRTMKAIRQAEELSSKERKSPQDFIISLFFPEIQLPGFKGKDALHTYILSSTMFILATAATLYVISLYLPRTKRYLTIRIILTICCICIPAVIVLGFSAGWAVYQPLPQGLNKLKGNPINSQGLVFPLGKAKEVVKWNTENRELAPSHVVSGYGADLVWTLNPPVVQHVGRHSLKGEYFEPANEVDRRTARQLFNFAFELNDANELRKEHEMITHVQSGDR